ncbi:MAG: MFS transporter, partial [Marinirhabdus sp.]|nr:MFS transporter [Marinirhabdus sp.]
MWFAGNGILTQLSTHFGLQANALGHLTSAVQFGFISGTLLFSIFTIADRVSPSRVFFACALLGAFSNLGILWTGNTLLSLIGIRFVTGFFLAGIYPVGMKIAADYFDQGLGKSLGFLVGALVLGTAFPHALQGISFTVSWQAVVWLISGIAILGGTLLMVSVPDGPYRQAAFQLDIKAVKVVFQNTSFKKAAFGYFGHMWELYAFWTFVPVLLTAYANTHKVIQLSISYWAFVIIAIGALGCIAAGLLSARFQTISIARISLIISGLCCLSAPLLIWLNWPLFIGVLLLWGVAVIADSPMFSTLVAQNASPKHKATALTIVNCIGFSITILSIQLLTFLQGFLSVEYLFVFLAL